MKVPKLVLEAATQLHEEGYHYAEAYPMAKWVRQKWPEETKFYQMVDGCLKIMRAIETLSSGSWSES